MIPVAGRRITVLALAPVAVLAALVAVLVAGARSDKAGSGTLSTGGQAAPFTLADVRNPDRQVSFSGTPAKPTVVNFFAAWCGPCREELPHLVAEAKARPGIDFIGVDVADVRTDAVRLLDDTGVGFPAGFDPRRDVARRYGVVGMPTTVFIAPGGRIVVSHQGEVSHAELRGLLDRLEAA